MHPRRFHSTHALSLAVMAAVLLISVLSPDLVSGSSSASVLSGVENVGRGGAKKSTTLSASSLSSADPVVEENPYYEPSDSDDDSDNDSDDDSEKSEDEYDEEEDEYDDEEEDADGKSIWNKALSTSSKGLSRSAKFAKDKRTLITVALAIFAFRREIWGFILAATTTAPKDGSGRRKLKFRITPTSILKIAIFIDLMRNMQSSPDGQSPNSSSYLLRPGGRAGFIGHLFNDYMTANPTYLPPIEQHYTFERINDRYAKDTMAFRKALTTPALASRHVFPTRPSLVTSSITTYSDKQPQYNGTAIILDLKPLDMMVSNMDSLRDQVSYLLHQHRSNIDLANKLHQLSMNTTSNNNTTTNNNNAKDNNSTIPTPELEIVLLLESPGGSASDYGLAASHIQRLRDEPGITLTICVDKVAASGGYMMACVSSPGRLFAAPFAVVGSIGVIGQAINVDAALRDRGVRPLVFRGGRDKAPVGLVGEVTREGIAKVQDMVDRTHRAFKDHVVSARPEMLGRIEGIATGDTWLARDAVRAGLIDRVVTSDEYIGERMKEGARILKLVKYQRPRFVFGSSLHRPGGVPVGVRIGSFVRDFATALSDARRILSKLKDVVDGIPSNTANEDISDVVAARALGVNCVQARAQ